MDVGIDEPRQQGITLAINNPAIIGQAPGRAADNLFDPLTFNDDGTVIHGIGAGTVDDAGVYKY